jgi:gluconate kinase
MVMKEAKKIRSGWLTIRLNEDEEKTLNKFFTQTSCNSLSEYARDILLKKPVTIFYRNKSADDFLEEMILLKKELNAIGNNFNQLVHKLHTLDNIQEIKSWAMINEEGRKIFLKKMEEINEKMNLIYEQWLQK